MVDPMLAMILSLNVFSSIASAGAMEEILLASDQDLFDGGPTRDDVVGRIAPGKRGHPLTPPYTSSTVV